QSIVHLHLALGVLSALLTLLSTHQPYHTLGVPILRAILAPQATRRLNAHLNSTQADLVLVTLKLWNSISDYGAGMEKKSVYEAFAWTNKSLFRLFHMKRKGGNDTSVDPFSKPDIRTLYITFLLGFLRMVSTPAVKVAFLEAHKDIFFGVFKRIADDHYQVIRFVLEVCWEGIWSDNKIKRTLKVTLFGEEVLVQLVKLYSRSVPELPDEDESVPADLVHHFLLALCTRPGTGICFKDNGWYSREEAEDAIDERPTHKDNLRGSRKIYNPILSRFLRYLRPMEDARQQELAIRILRSCPELVGGYWASSGLTMEPRLSSRWLTSTAWLADIISLPVPIHTFVAGGASSNLEYNTDPPPLSSALDNILPPVWSRVSITKGLQSTSHLVQHHTATCLARCLEKYDAVRQSYEAVALALEEERSGNWTSRVRELEAELRKRVPTFEVIVGFVQQKSTSSESGPQNTIEPDGKILQSLMVSEAALRLMLLYHKVLSDLPADARYDVGKLLSTGVGKRLISAPQSLNIAPEHVTTFETLCHVHILDLLQHSDQYIWGITLGQSSLRHFLSIYNPTRKSGISERCGKLLHKVLSRSALFEHDPGELRIWLDALHSIRADRGAPEFYSLLDECIISCLRSPLEYVTSAFLTENSSVAETTNVGEPVEAYDPSSVASPLLMALLKEFEALKKAEDGRLSLQIAIYLRQVIFGVSLKQPSSRYGLQICGRLKQYYLAFNRETSPQPVLRSIEREIHLLESQLYLVEAHSQVDLVQANSGIENFSSITNGFEDRFGKSTTAAYELINWLRLNFQEVSLDLFSYSVQVLEEWDPVAIPSLVLLADPAVTPLLAILRSSKSLNTIPFPLAMVHTRPSDFKDEAVRKDLANLTISSTAYEAQLFGNLLLKRVAGTSFSDEEDIQQLLYLWAEIVGISRLSEVKAAYQRLFLSSASMQTLLEIGATSQLIAKGLSELVLSLFDPQSAEDRLMVREWCQYWAQQLFQSSDMAKAIRGIRLWIPFMGQEELITVCGCIVGEDDVDERSSYYRPLLEDTFTILEKYPKLAEGPLLATYLPRLVALQASISINKAAYRFLRAQMSADLPSGLMPIKAQGNASELMQHIEGQWESQRRDSSDQLLKIITPHLELGEKDDLELALLGMFRSTHLRNKVADWLLAQSEPNLSINYALDALLGISAKTSPYLQEMGQRLGPSCLTLALSAANSRREDYQSSSLKLLSLVEDGYALVKLAVQLVSKRPTVQVIPFLARLIRTGKVPKKEAETLLLLSLKEVVSFLNEPLESKDVVHAIAQLTEFINVSPETLDAFFQISIRNHLMDADVMSVLGFLFARLPLKPAVCNRFIQAILHHSQFLVVTSHNAPARDSLITVLYHLFVMHPQNTCQPSHITPLIQVYRGTLSNSDLSLLDIFRLFEQHRKYSVTSLMASWSPDSGVVSTDILYSITSLNANLIFATCVEFPQWRKTQGSPSVNPGASKGLLYDPLFILLLLHSFLSTKDSRRPLTALDWVGLLRTNIASLAVASLSARHEGTRDLGWTALGGLYKAIEHAEFYEKSQTAYVLKMLVRLYGSTSTAAESSFKNPRLSTYTTLFFAHALRAVFNPSSALYPLVSRFLLQRPEFDPNDPPMLYSMLYSSLSNDFGKGSGNWKRERIWMLRFLADGMVSSQDWTVLQRRHTWDLLATMYQTHENDRIIKHGILKVLVKMTQNQRAATSLICRNHLLSWSATAISGMPSTEDDDTVILWCQALENVVVCADPDRTTRRMGHIWYSQMLQCISKLLDLIEINSSSYPVEQSLEALCISTRVIQRVSSLSTIQAPSTAISKALATIKKVEARVHFSLEDIAHWSPVLLKWGEVQERLWLATMHTNDEKDSDLQCWNLLTARMVALGSVKPAILSE
ncbi:hypothetical protein FRC17_001713, partial [Serendipita sp. 399]